MRYGKCYSFFLLSIIAVLAFSSCQKENNIDNNKVIKTPYVVWFGQKMGQVSRTNDGILYKDLFGPDGVPIRSISPSGNNIIFIKGVLRLSVNNGQDWNAVMGSGPSNPIPAVNPNAKWGSMMLDVPGDRLYVASTKSNGVEVSADNGVTWEVDPTFPGSSASVASFTQTTDGKLWGLDQNGGNVYVKGSKNVAWTQVSVTTGLPTGNSWYLASFNNTLIATDYNGANGIYYSDNGGQDWKPYSGFNGRQQILACAAPMNQVVLAGTDSTGIYRLDPTTGKFLPSNNGLESVTSVYGITGKQDTYKNGIIKRYVYITTNRGLYRSQDLGQNWEQVYPGDLRAIW
jgi:ligand-binding sensor domain-containing protein